MNWCHGLDHIIWGCGLICHIRQSQQRSNVLPSTSQVISDTWHCFIVVRIQLQHPMSIICHEVNASIESGSTHINTLVSKKISIRFCDIVSILINIENATMTDIRWRTVNDPSVMSFIAPLYHLNPLPKLGLMWLMDLSMGLNFTTRRARERIASREPLAATRATFH